MAELQRRNTAQKSIHFLTYIWINSLNFCPVNYDRIIYERVSMREKKIEEIHLKDYIKIQMLDKKAKRKLNYLLHKIFLKLLVYILQKLNYLDFLKSSPEDMFYYGF